MNDRSANSTNNARFDVVDVIATKRDGGELCDDQIDWVIDAFMRGTVTAEQMSALAMAIVINSMTQAETASWTQAMIASGQRLNFASLKAPTVDKHSTGGVGDKITLALAPLVAAHGVAVPQLSGRGLGHTGGTLDKLESIPGWRAELSTEQLSAQLADIGAAICAAGAVLAPADKKLYALRDVTGTVESIPLIASSIMSKKVAEGTQSLVLDVKVGTGAFMHRLGDARELAQTMVALGTAAGVETSALLTDMSTPLGRSAGNAIEVAEACDVLAGGGPADVRELTLALAGEMLEAAGKTGIDPSQALDAGHAMDVWRRMITAQGGDPDAGLPAPAVTHDVLAHQDGIVMRMDARAVGVCAWRLGAGRAVANDSVDSAAGVLIHVKPGEPIRSGQRLFTLQTNDPERLPRAIEALEMAIDIEQSGTSPESSVVFERVDAGGLR